MNGMLIRIEVIEIIDDAGQHPPLPDLPDVDRWLYVRDDCVMLISATGHEHDAHFVLELWKSEPPQAAGSCEARQDARPRLASGLVELAIQPTPRSNVAERSTARTVAVFPNGTARTTITSHDIPRDVGGPRWRRGSPSPAC
jgi:hypothetical protein